MVKTVLMKKKAQKVTENVPKFKYNIKKSSKLTELSKNPKSKIVYRVQKMKKMEPKSHTFSRNHKTKI